MSEDHKYYLSLLVPRFVARWMIAGWGRHLPWPLSWSPWLYGRMLGSRPKRIG